jgi:hypothetical protein
MGLLRIILYVVLIYLVYKLLKNLLKPAQKQRFSMKGKSQNDTPPPYDPNQVEDIDYEEVKRKNREDAEGRGE